MKKRLPALGSIFPALTGVEWMHAIACIAKLRRYTADQRAVIVAKALKLLESK